MAKNESMSAADYQAMIRAAQDKPVNRFKNVWTMVDGINFQSKIEADYYGRLKLRKRAGNIKDFEHGVIYHLTVNRVLICTYRADFVITHNDGSKSVIDTKSDATETYSFKLKKKLMKALFNIEIQVVKK